MSHMSEPGPSQPVFRTPILWVIAEWLLYFSVALIVTGMLLPSVYKPGLLGGKDYNVFQVIIALFKNEYRALGIIVFAFSVVFPLLKNLVAAIILRLGASHRPRLIELLHFLGKWSMLDVLLAAFLIGFTQLTAIMKIEPRLGLYIFAAGIILNNLASLILSKRFV